MFKLGWEDFGLTDDTVYVTADLISDVYSSSSLQTSDREALSLCGVIAGAGAVSFFAAAFECDVPHLGMSKVDGLLGSSVLCGSHVL